MTLSDHKVTLILFILTAKIKLYTSVNPLTKAIKSAFKLFNKQI